MKEFKRFPMIVMSVIAFMAVTSLSGCESAEEKQLRLERSHQVKMAKIASGQDALEQEMYHERSLARIQRPVAPGSYIDYRGNTDYGYWNQYGNWEWNDPRSGYATQSRNFVDYQMAMGIAGAAVLTQAAFNRNNSSGWQSTNVTVNNYTSIDGKTISKEKYKNRVKTINSKSTKLKKHKTAKTVSKSTGTKKVASKWESKRKVEPTYGKKGFKSKFQANKKKSASKNIVKTSYKSKKTKKPVKQKKRKY